MLIDKEEIKEVAGALFNREAHMRTDRMVDAHSGVFAESYSGEQCLAGLHG